jgi:hypothetical protein
LYKSIEELQSQIQSCGSNQQIVIDLSLVPRPPALMEAIRRYYGKALGKELDQVKLFGFVK